MLFDFVNNIALISTMLFIAGQLLREKDPIKSGLRFKIYIGLGGGLLAVLLMIYTVKYNNNIFDLRHIAIVVSAFYGGPVSSLITSIIIAIFRLTAFKLTSASIIASTNAIFMAIVCSFIRRLKLPPGMKFTLLSFSTLVMVNLSLIIIINDGATYLNIVKYLNPISIAGSIFTYFTCNYITSANASYRESKYYRIMTDNLFDLVSTHDSKGSILYISPSCYNLLGYTQEELKSMDYTTLILEEDLEKILEENSKDPDFLENSTFTFRIKNKAGVYKCFETTLEIIGDKESSSHNQLICVSRDITTRKVMEEKLIQSNKTNIEILESIKDGLFTLDKDFRIKYINPAGEQILHKSSEELKDKYIYNVLPSLSNEATMNKYLNLLDSNSTNYVEEYLPEKNKWFSIKIYNSSTGYSVYFEDITSKILTQQQLDNIHQRLQAIFNNAGMGIILKDLEGNIIDGNPYYFNMLGTMLTHEEIEAQAFPEDISLENDYIEKIKNYEICHANFEKRYKLNEEHLLYTEVTINLLPSQGNDPNYLIYIINDITIKKAAEIKLLELNSTLKKASFMDGLTGIPNRRYYDEYFIAQWEECKAKASPLSMILLDIDYFKLFNDTYGHIEGDECLKLVASTLSRVLHNKEHIPFRYGGEEFVVILPNTKNQEALAIAENIRRAIEDLKIPNKDSSISPFVTISAGLSTVIPKEGSLKEDFFDHTDKSLYCAKSTGRNRICNKNF